MSSPNQYDAIVIGAGQAGPSLSAGMAEDLGWRVALIEAHKVGGSCVNYGCTPSKTIIASARVAHLARRGADYGIHTGEITVDIERVMARKTERVEDARSGLAEWLESIENVDLIYAYGAFEGTTEDGLHLVRAGDRLLRAPRVFLNTGTRHRWPDVDGLDDVHALDYHGVLDLSELPRHLIVLGGGYVGLEMAQAYRRLGSDVTIVERGDHLANKEDEDISKAIEDILRDEGVRVMLETRADAARSADGGDVALEVAGPDGTERIVGSHLLVAAGRVPNSDRMGLDTVGVQTGDGGTIPVDDRLRTNIAGIWALGDVNGRGAFTHTSYQDHEVVLDNLKGGDRRLHRTLTYALFIDPPLGRVGMTEREALASGREVLRAVKPMEHVSRALEQGETKGMIKLLADAETRQLIGAAVLGMHGDEVIQAISYFMATGAPFEVMERTLPVHPTIAEYLPTILGELELVGSAEMTEG